jgi:sugar lactone lactonase YvrE
VISNVVQNNSQGDAVMNPFGARSTLRFAVVAMLAVTAGAVYSQSREPINSLPNPYRSITDWGKMPAGRTWGSTAGVDVDRDGSSDWVAERCGAFAPPSSLKPGVPFACDGSKLDPILKFDASGKLVKAFGAGMFLFPHGLHVDHDGNVWVTDGLGNDGKGQQVIKFSPDGKELMRLGKAGVAGSGPDEFNAPSAVYVAPDGNVFVADGHGGDTNARIVKFTKDGKYVKEWGKKGSGPGEFDAPHGLAMDSAGRLFVADRSNSRIQLFDQDGKFLADWRQFGRPSGVFIDKNDTLYVADSTSTDKTNPGFAQGIRIGSVKDGKVTAYIPETKELSSLEGVAADDAGNVYGGYTNTLNFRRFVRKPQT